MKTKLMFLIPTLENGGAEKVLVNLVNNFDYKRYDITVQTIFDWGIHRKNLREQVHYRSFFKKPFRGYTRLLWIIPSSILYRFIIKDKYDIVIAYLEGSSAKIVSGCPYPDSKKIAWIHTVMDTPKRLRIGFPNLKTALDTYNSFDKIVFVSLSALQAFIATSTLTQLHGEVLYNTVESDKIRLLSTDIVHEINIDKNTFNICIVGKITPNKGVDRLAHILNRLKKEGLAAHIYAVGTGEQQNEIESYINKNNLKQYFTFLGYRENPYKFIAACDLYVCASHREGFSTAVTEALIVGTPVVSTNCSGAYELLGENNEFGIVTENNEEGLYTAIKTLLQNPELLAYYRKQAKLRGDSFSTERTVQDVEKMLEEVVDG